MEKLSEIEQRFFYLLKKNKRIIYDFKRYKIWVLENYEDEESSESYCVDAEYLLTKTGMDAFTNADIAWGLKIVNGIDVDIRNFSKD